MKRFLSILLATVVLFSLPACEDKALSESLKAEETYVDSMVGEMPSDEYDRAIWYGFVGQELSRNKNRTVTWREYCTMIGAMLSLKDEILCAQWQELASLALNSDDEMVRDQGCFALYRAAELIGEEFNDGGIRSVSTNPHLLPSNDGNLPFSWNYTPFTGDGNDAWVFENTYEGLFGTMKYIEASMMFCQYRMSLCSFETLYDSQKDIIGPLTVEDAVLSVLRLYESDPNVAETFWLNKIEKINEESNAMMREIRVNCTTALSFVR